MKEERKTKNACKLLRCKKYKFLNRFIIEIIKIMIGSFVQKKKKLLHYFRNYNFAKSSEDDLYFFKFEQI